jgi:hypothetical protein
MGARSRTHAPSSLQNIRLSSAAGNSLRGSRNWRADGDGCVVFACRCHGVLSCVTVRTVGSGALATIVERSHLDCRKPLRRFLRFHPCHRTIGAAGGALVGSELWRGSLSDRMLIAANPCAALFVSTVSPDDRRCSAGARCRSCHRFTCPVLAPPLHGQGPLHPGSVQKAGRRMCSVIRGMLLGPSRKLLSCRATSSAFDSHFAPSGNF